MEKPLKILFADDSPDLLELFKWHVEDEGWKGVFVTTARQIIDAVNNMCEGGEDCFDVIVADVNYFDDHNDQPRLTGITAAREIRRNHPNLPIIFISGWVSLLVRQEARKVEGHLMTKPFDWADLAAKIRSLAFSNRKFISDGLYSGSENRTQSLNRTAHRRRSTDVRPLSIPPAIEKVMQEIRHEREALKSR